MVTHIDTDSSITISAVQSGVDIKYPSIDTAKMTRIISVGEKVKCRASPIGILKEIDDDGSVTIELLPLGTLKKYPSIGAAKMIRFQPPLDVYERDTRFDTTPIFVKQRVENFYHTHVPISPNKQDMVRKRHKLYLSQFEEK